MTSTDNNGNTYINRNKCRSFNATLTTTLTAMVDQICSEVIVINQTGQAVNVYDGGYDDALNAMQIPDKGTFTFKGVTNSMQLSAATASGSGTLYYRTQYYNTSVQ